MLRRLSLAAPLLALACAAAAQQPRVSARLLLQSSPLAGFNYYAAPELFAQMQPGDRLDLVREPDNPHDPRAVRVEWRGHKLGYVPRRDNAEVARLMDAGEALDARVSRLRQHPNPRLRIEMEIYEGIEKRPQAPPAGSP